MQNGEIIFRGYKSSGTYTYDILNNKTLMIAFYPNANDIDLAIAFVSAYSESQTSKALVLSTNQWFSISANNGIVIITITSPGILCVRRL